MTRVEEIWIGSADFKAVRGAPILDGSCWGFPAGLQHGDGIEAAIQVNVGDRILSLEPDIDMELGLMLLELGLDVGSGMNATAGELVARQSLLRLDGTGPVGAPTGRQTLTYAVRRTIPNNGARTAPKSRMWLRIEVQHPELMRGELRFVHGAALRIARAA